MDLFVERDSLTMRQKNGHKMAIVQHWNLAAKTKQIALHSIHKKAISTKVNINCFDSSPG